MPATKPTSWQRAALRLAVALPVDALSAPVRTHVVPGSAAARGRGVVACSGGADSGALVQAVWAHGPAKRG